MNATRDLTPVDLLVLSRLLVGSNQGVTLKALTRDLRPLLEHCHSGTALQEQIVQSLNELAERGQVQLERTKKGDLSKARTTTEGHESMLFVLGLEALPPKTTWAQLKKNYLPAVALDLPTPKGDDLKLFKTETGFKAALARSQFQLPVDTSYPTKKKAYDQLFWKLLGIESSQDFNVTNIKKALLGRELNRTVAQPDQGVNLLLAQKVGARRTDRDEIRWAALRRWIDREITSGKDQPREKPISLKDFAHRAKQAARSCPTGRFGENKVFIAHVWRQLSQDPVFNGMDINEFKKRLAEANNARLLDLSRADLVQAMDPDDVRESEVQYLGATCHFIRT